MIEPNWSTTNHLYGPSTSNGQVFLPVQHPMFRKLFVEIRSLRKGLGDQYQDPFFSNILRPVTRFLFKHLGSPIPFNEQESVELFEDFQAATENIEQSSPRQALAMRAIASAMGSLVDIPDNPMADALSEILEDKNHVATTGLVVHRARPVQAVEEAMLTLGLGPDFTVLVPSDLRNHTTYHRLIIFGQDFIARDSPFVLTAPRAPELYRIGYNGWLRFPQVLNRPWDISDDNQLYWSFTDVSTTAATNDDTELADSDPKEAPTPAGQPAHEDLEPIDPLDLIPILDITQILGAKTQEHDIHELRPEGEELVSAILVELESGNGTFLGLTTSPDIETPRKYDTLTVSTDNILNIDRYQARDLEPGMFLLLRTGAAGGDYLDFVSDLIIGEAATSFRDSRRQWKGRLRNRVISRGIAKVADELQGLGCAIASPQNIRNWISVRNIAPGNAAHFEILLKYIDREEQFGQLQDQVLIFRNAALRSGNFISQALKQQVTQMSGNRLSGVISHEFTMPGENAGSLTAFRIYSIDQEEYQVPLSQIQKLFSME